MSAVSIPTAELTPSLLDRLLDPSDPALQVRVLTDLLDRPADDPDVVEARDRITEQPWIRATLDAHHGDGTWGRGFYTKYDGTSWVLLHLAEVGAPMDHPAIQAGADHLLETARPASALRGARGEPFRDLEGGYYWLHPINCLAAHMALVLIRSGYPDHPVTRGALDLCAHRFQARQGFGCFVMDDSLLPACFMTVPKVMKPFLTLPEEYRTDADRALIDGMVDLLLEHHLYRYVPEANGEWFAWASTVSAGERRAARTQWIADGRLEPRKEKPGWLRFSFPGTYNSDLLEVLLMLGEAGVPRNDVIEAGLRVLLDKRTPDGMWKMVGGVNGKMHADLDRKGKPSPWITYRALLALKRFDALSNISTEPRSP